MKTSSRLAGWSLTLLVPLAPLLAQQPPAGDSLPGFEEILDVRVVNLEVVVTDRQGNRVTDLQPGDFRLKVDRKEVPITFFTEVREGQALASAAEAAPGDEAAAATGAAPSGPVGTNYLVFIDDYFSVALHRNEVLAALKADLAQLGPRDRMSIIAYDGARLARISGWTGSAAELAKAIDAAMARPPRGLDRITELRSFLQSDRIEYQLSEPVISGRTLSTGPVTPSVNSGMRTVERIAAADLTQQEKAFGITLVRQIGETVNAVVSAMRGSAAPEGRKVLLLLAGGWPFSVQSFLRGPDNPVTSHELPDGEEMFRLLTSTANLLGYTIYPVDVPGIGTGAADAEINQSLGTIASQREQEVEGSISFLAHETGGEAILNSRRLAALRTAAADTRTYYWLGFTPTWERNDKRHTLEIEVLRRGLQARSRNNFLDLSFKTEMNMLLESALLFDVLPNTIPMPMRLGTPMRSSTGEVVIPITLGLPVDALTVIASNGKYHGRVELRISAADEQGNRSQVVSLPLDLASDHPPTTGGFVRYETKVTLHGKASHIAAVTYDMLSGKMAAAQGELSVDPTESKPKP